MNKEEIKQLAIWLHETYENKARIYDWKTQEKCRVTFDELPEANAKTMLAVALEISNKLDQARTSLLAEIEGKIEKTIPTEEEGDSGVTRIEAGLYGWKRGWNYCRREILKVIREL